MSSAHPFDILNGHNFMSLTTYRKNGQPVPTPVWFARDGDRLVVLTQRESGKVKRIRHTPRVTIAPCTARGDLLGPSAEAVARLLEPSEYLAAIRALNRKYGLQKRLFELMWRLTGRGRSVVYLELKPA